MSKRVENLPLKPLARSVSIIGVGATPFMKVLGHPDADGLGEGEMFGSAAIAAMKDAGISPKDIDYYFQAQAIPSIQSDYLTPNAQMGPWFGMRGKPSSHHSEACATGYVALEQAVLAVASGAYDIVLSGCCDMSLSCAIPGKPSFFRQFFAPPQFASAVSMLYDKSYAAPALGANPMACDGWMETYRQTNGLTHQQVEDIMCQLSIDSRRAAALNPRALKRTTIEQDAAKVGLSVHDYMRSSEYNPKMTNTMRRENFEARADGAVAVIVCPTEMAYKYTDHPIEVLGSGHAVLDGGSANVEQQATSAAYRQIKELTGLSGKDMDLFICNDFFMSSQLLAAEECEYLPKGQGWKYVLESRTAFDGDKPINTNGGRCQYGHAHGSSGLADVYEAVMQLRGKMGPTQIKGDPKYVMLRAFGGGQNVLVQILKKL